VLETERSIQIFDYWLDLNGVVPWIVETEGKRVFHAGDLNNWYARFLPEAVTGETFYSEEFFVERSSKADVADSSSSDSRLAFFLFSAPAPPKSHLCKIS